MLLTILYVILLVWLISALLSWVPAPNFQGRNPLFVVVIVIVLLLLLRGPLGLRW